MMTVASTDQWLTNLVNAINIVREKSFLVLQLEYCRYYRILFNRPGVAGAVL